MAQNNKNMHYSRDTARSELSRRGENISKYSVDENNIRNPDQELIITELKAKDYRYKSIYAYVFDLICAFITDHLKDEDAIKLLANNYYLIDLTRPTIEKYAFGKYIKVRSKFWDEFYELCKSPKTLVMHTQDGDFLGEPIRITITLEDGTSIKNNFKYLKNAQKMIKSVKIEFFRLMFKPLVEDHNNWLPLPRNLQAIIDTMLIENPELGKYHVDNEERRLTSQEIRLYLLYLSDHDNHKNYKLAIDAINFWRCIRPYNIEKYQPKKTKQYKYRIRNSDTAFAEFKCLVQFGSKLKEEGSLHGVNFTAKKPIFNKNTKEYKITIIRDSVSKMASSSQIIQTSEKT